MAQRKSLQFLWSLVYKSMQRKYSFKLSVYLILLNGSIKKHTASNYINYIIIPYFVDIGTLFENLKIRTK